MSDENKAIARRIFDEIWNQGKLDVADEIYADNYVTHGHAVELPSGPAGFKKLVSIFRTAFPDIQFTIEDLIAEGDKVVTRWKNHGTHKGDLMGVELPITIEAVIQETDPGVRGDTATGGSKPATLETGAVIQVPLFVNIGDTIRVDTRTGEYLDRVKN